MQRYIQRQVNHAQESSCLSDGQHFCSAYALLLQGVMIGRSNYQGDISSPPDALAFPS